MSLHEYLSHQIGNKLAGDATRFDDLWKLVPDFFEKLRSFDSNDAWLHWSKKTFDGWYCLSVEEDCYEIFYQERGHQYPSEFFSDKHAAVRFAFNCAGITFK